MAWNPVSRSNQVFDDIPRRSPPPPPPPPPFSLINQAGLDDQSVSRRVTIVIPWLREGAAMEDLLCID